MADDLDAELLALAGDSEEETSPPPKSPAHSDSSHARDRDTSPAAMGRKGTAKSMGRRSRKPTKDESEGEVSDDGSRHSLQSAPMSESESEADNSGDDEDRPIFPYDKLYYSAQDKKDIMAMPEIQREETLSERAQQVDRHNQDLALRRLLASRSREEARAAKKAKRKAGSAGLDDNQRKSSRQKTTLGGRKVGETSGAIEAYKRQREQKGKRDELRRRDPGKSRRRSRSIGSDISDEDADAESDLELDDRVGRSVSIPKDDPPAELREIRRAQVGRNNFAKVCFYPGFENAMIGCYARLSIGPHPDSGQNEYRLGLITGISQGKPYALEGENGRSFVTDQYVKLAHGKSVRDFPFVTFSNSPLTEAEYRRYVQTLTVEDCKMATKSKVESKVADINRLLNHTFTREELNEKLRRQGAFDHKKNVLNRLELERNLEFAKVNGNMEEAEKIETELQKMVNPTLSWGTSLVKKEVDRGPSEAERVHQINLRNQKLNIENGRRAQLEERKAAKKAAEAVARGEAAPNPFMRVRTVAKTHHDVSGTPKSAAADATSVDTSKDTPGTTKSNGSPAQKGTPASRVTPKKPKNGFMISYRNTDDENIAALDMDIDIEI
ncbi:Plus-3 [Penicillium cf. griseofulvum]|uniref:Plus-3 n=1 Tax=Penicillium cf. griseofulvum TaxID=2972120 RepID=A0A9W9N0P8_9EURO|nr:Plus-3 [Penicillium cf. griseofulvum]KAJ5421955.1 Plus-3 [Penicillium cf. griseofulvum]